MRVENNGDNTAPRRRMRRKKKKNGKLLYVLLLVLLLGILAFSAVKIISYLSQQHIAETSQSNIIDQFVTPKHDDLEGDRPGVSGEVSAGEPEPEQIDVDFKALQKQYPDVVGYIYGANTAINGSKKGISYPIVQGDDNDFYLNHDIDGNSNNNGSIFMEYLCASDFSSKNSIIYGHHMKSGLMFAPIEQYKSQSYYDAHPYMYIYTPQQNYRLEFFAGCVVEGSDGIYTLDVTKEQLKSYVSKSTFKSKIGVPTGNIVTLSTCDYTAGYSDPRYILLGQLVEID